MSIFRTVAAIAALSAIVPALAGCEKTPTRKAADKTARAVDRTVDNAKDLDK